MEHTQRLLDRLGTAINIVDRQFGEGFAIKNPIILGAMLNAVVIDELDTTLDTTLNTFREALTDTLEVPGGLIDSLNTIERIN